MSAGPSCSADAKHHVRSRLKSGARLAEKGDGVIGRVLQRYQGYMFVLPAMAILAALIVYPLVDTFVLSVTNESGRYVGAENFMDVLQDDTTTLATINSVIYVGGSILFQVVLGTVAGILLNRPLIGRGALRAVMLVPWVVPGIVAATSWAWMFHHEFGIINFGLMEAGVLSTPVGWLTDPQIVLFSLIAVNVWKMFPFVAVMVLAGLQGIPESLYEAARMDGARFVD